MIRREPAYCAAGASFRPRQVPVQRMRVPIAWLGRTRASEVRLLLTRVSHAEPASFRNQLAANPRSTAHFVMPASTRPHGAHRQQTRVFLVLPARFRWLPEQHRTRHAPCVMQANTVVLLERGDRTLVRNARLESLSPRGEIPHQAIVFHVQRASSRTRLAPIPPSTARIVSPESTLPHQEARRRRRACSAMQTRIQNPRGPPRLSLARAVPRASCLPPGVMLKTTA